MARFTENNSIFNEKYSIKQLDLPFAAPKIMPTGPLKLSIHPGTGSS